MRRAAEEFELFDVWVCWRIEVHIWGIWVLRHFVFQWSLKPMTILSSFLFLYLCDVLHAPIQNLLCARPKVVPQPRACALLRFFSHVVSFPTQQLKERQKERNRAMTRLWALHSLGVVVSIPQYESLCSFTCWASCLALTLRLHQSRVFGTRKHLPLQQTSSLHQHQPADQLASISSGSCMLAVSIHVSYMRAQLCYSMQLSLCIISSCPDS